MTETDTIAPAGWRLMRIYYNGKPPEVDPLTCGGAASLSWCQRMKRLWEASYLNDGQFDLSVEPCGGWAALDGDPLAAIVYATAAGDLSAESAIAQLRPMMAENGT
jgi:hypothetical protein